METTLADYMDDVAKAETKRILLAAESFPNWLASQDTIKWSIRSWGRWQRIWCPNEVDNGNKEVN